MCAFQQKARSKERLLKREKKATRERGRREHSKTVVVCVFGNGESRYLDDEERPPVLVERERHDDDDETMMMMMMRREATQF